MRTAKVWHLDRNGHRRCGKFALVNISGDRYGLVHGSEYLGPHDSVRDAEQAAWEL